jgi:hypothetical protein
VSGRDEAVGEVVADQRLGQVVQVGDEHTGGRGLMSASLS